MKTDRRVKANFYGTVVQGTVLLECCFGFGMAPVCDREVSRLTGWKPVPHGIR